MKFALVDGQRSEPQPKIRGSCQRCHTEMIPKCGPELVWHWAHKSRIHCDPWWESETEWHRNWKDRFPTEWQEIVLQDERTGEHHFADVRTANGLVIEFQRSAIDPAEVHAREAFYQTMIWVVDGCKNEFDKVNFGNMRTQPEAPDWIVGFQWHGRSKFFARWYAVRPYKVACSRGGLFHTTE